MACGARLGLKLPIIRGITSIIVRLNGLWSPFGFETSLLTTVALLSAEEEVSPPPGRLNKQAATSGELAEPLPPVLTPPWSTPGWVPDVGCSCGCGSVDVRARPLWGRATHDEP